MSDDNSFNKLSKQDLDAEARILEMQLQPKPQPVESKPERPLSKIYKESHEMQDRFSRIMNAPYVASEALDSALAYTYVAIARNAGKLKKEINFASNWCISAFEKSSMDSTKPAVQAAHPDKPGLFKRHWLKLAMMGIAAVPVVQGVQETYNETGRIPGVNDVPRVVHNSVKAALQDVAAVVKWLVGAETTTDRPRNVPGTTILGEFPPYEEIQKMSVEEIKQVINDGIERIRDRGVPDKKIAEALEKIIKQGRDPARRGDIPPEMRDKVGPVLDHLDKIVDALRKGKPLPSADGKSRNKKAEKWGRKDIQSDSIASQVSEFNFD